MRAWNVGIGLSFFNHSVSISRRQSSGSLLTWIESRVDLLMPSSEPRYSHFGLISQRVFSKYFRRESCNWAVEIYKFHTFFLTIYFW